MFTDQNQQFLKSFGAVNEDQQNCSNLEFYNINEAENNLANPPLVNKRRSNQPSSSNNEQQRIDFFQPVADLSKFKRNNLITTMHKTRKFSQQQGIDLLKFQLKNQEMEAKSEASGKSSKSQNQEEENNDERSNKSISAKSYKFDITEIQGALMKKIRNLQARIKNIDLNYKTVIMKLRQENSQQERYLNYYKDYLSKGHQKILQEINQYIKNREEQIDDFQSSSSGTSNKNNDQLMPIMSKIQEIKFDGQKLCETLKNYQQSLSKRAQIEEELIKQKEEQIKNELQPKKKFILRKYSIPLGNVREKKSSFQTTMISQIKQRDVRISNQENICSKCKMAIGKNTTVVKDGP